LWKILYSTTTRSFPESNSGSDSEYYEGSSDEEGQEEDEEGQEEDEEGQEEDEEGQEEDEEGQEEDEEYKGSSSKSAPSGKGKGYMEFPGDEIAKKALEQDGDTMEAVIYWVSLENCGEVRTLNEEASPPEIVVPELPGVKYWAGRAVEIREAKIKERNGSGRAAGVLPIF